MEEKYLYSTKFNKTSSLYLTKFSFNFTQVFMWNFDDKEEGGILIINGKPL